MAAAIVGTAVAMLAAGSGGADPGALTFAAATHYATGMQPWMVATGDFNNDGKTDVALPNLHSGSVSVLLGDGAGSYSSRVDVPVSGNPGAVAVADFNHDGNADLAVTEGDFSPYVAILLGNGHGAFTTSPHYLTDSADVFNQGIAVGANADGTTDIAVANAGANSITLLLAASDGTISRAAPVTVDAHPELLSLADLNGDGILDLAVVASNANTVDVLLGTGDDTFGAVAHYGSDTNASDVAVGDLDGDGVPDLAVTDYGSGTVSVLHGNGDGSFGGQRAFGTGSHPESVAIADLDGDGNPDLAVANGDSGTVSVLLGDGTGSFAAAQDFATGAGPLSVAAADLNGDGKPDLLTADATDSTVSALLNTTAASSGGSSSSFVVTTTADSTDGACTAALCSLRDAVEAANAAGGGAVTVPAGTYRLTSGPLTVTSPIGIAGAGARETILSGNGTGQVIRGDATTAAPIVLQDLTVTDGQLTTSDVPGGGGIVSFGALTLDGVAVAYNGSNSDGGGVDAESSLTIVDSTINNNGASGAGGGIRAANGAVSIVNSTIAGNSAGTVGGIDLASPSSALIASSSIAGNTATGSAAVSVSGGSLTLRSVVLENDTWGGSSNCAGTIVSLGHNLATDGSCNLTGTGDQPSVADPKLGTLHDNGGETDTLLPQDGSPLIDAGPSECPSTDQRGAPRPAGAACDIGSVEVSAAVPPTGGGGGTTTTTTTTTTTDTPPVAAFTTSSSGSTVTVDGTGSSDADGSVASYSWDFGDGGSATGATASHTYLSTGTFTVTLVVTDDGGATGTVTHSVTVTGNQPPVAAFTATANGLQVSANASTSHDADGTIASYSWDFGDSSAAVSGQTANHIYAAAGTYTVALTVTDDGGSTATATQSVTVPALGAAGDCNANGVSDISEGSWSNRDDDGDGVCNGADNCPTVSNPTQANVCQMQAVTVPEKASDPTVPHPTYSGATITLEGIARYGGNQYMWDYGDGSSPTAWTNITNAYDLSVRHIYVGSAGQRFSATLSVRNSAAPATVATATYPVEIFQAANLSDPAQLDVRSAMAVDAALWHLHVTELRAASNDGPPAYKQPYGYWSESLATSCAALDAFEVHGDGPAADGTVDPYVEDAVRALNYALLKTTAASIGPQTAGNPDLNGNGLGLYMSPTDDTYTEGVCAMALADSGTPDRIAATGSTHVYGRRYAEIAQDLIEWFAYGQDDAVSTARGGWGYTANENFASGETFRWPIYAMESAEQRMGATVPAFVRSEIPYFLTTTHYTTHDNLYGGYGWNTPTSFTNDAFTATAIVADEFDGDPLSSPDAQAALGFLYRHWADNDGTWLTNLGDSDPMYTVARAMRDAPTPLTRITEWSVAAGQQTANSFDWLYTPTGQAQQGYATNLVSRQQPDGSWVDATGNGEGHKTGPVWSTAWDALVLMPPLARAQTPTGPTSTLTVTVTGGGHVTSAVSALPLICGGVCTRSVPQGSQVRLVVTSIDPGYVFGGWSGACTGTGDCTVDLTHDASVGATFVPTLTVTADGHGSVTGSPGSISCRSTCSTRFDSPAAVALTPAADPGYFFSGWTGDCSGTGACSVTVDVARSVGVHFTRNPDQAPGAAFADTVSSAAATPLLVSFDGSASVDPDGTIAGYSWNFGDGATGTGATASHTFPWPGTFTVTLTVVDDRGATTTVSHDVTVPAAGGNQPPVASFVQTTKGLSVALDATDTDDPGGAVTRYGWDFGDGSQGSGVRVTHTYAAAGTFTVTLTVADRNGATATATRSVAVGQDGRFSVDPQVLHLIGDVGETMTSGPIVLTMNTPPIAFTQAISGPAAADFSIVGGDCGGFIFFGSCTVGAIAFTPTAAGERDAVLTIAAVAGGWTQTVELRGYAAPSTSAKITPPAIGSVMLGKTKTGSIVIRNTGTQPLDVPWASVTGARAGEFSLADKCTKPLARGESCVVQVTYAPVTLGPTHATVVLYDNTPGGSQTTVVKAMGIGPLTDLSRSSIAFPDTIRHKAGTPRNVTVTNTGNRPLTVDAVSIRGADAADFSATSGCTTQTIAPGHTCTVAVTFKPSASGSASARLEITDDTFDGPHDVALTGHGVAIPTTVPTPRTLSFPTTPVTLTSADRAVRFTNTSEPDAAQLRGVRLTGTDAADWTIAANTCLSGAAIAPHANCRTTVAFAPKTSGLRRATLQLLGAGKVLAQVTLTGSGLQVPLQATAQATIDAPDFGTVVDGGAGTTSDAKTVTIANVGLAPLTITQVYIAESGFNVTSTNCVTKSPLAYLATCTATVVVTPHTVANPTPGKALTGYLRAVTPTSNAPQYPAFTAIWEPLSALTIRTNVVFYNFLYLQQSQAQTVPLENVGTAGSTRWTWNTALGSDSASVHVGSVTIDGPDASHFTETGCAETTISQQAGDCPFSIAGDFAPAGSHYTATVHFHVSGAGDAYRVTVTSGPAPH